MGLVANLVKKYECTKQQAKDVLTGKIDEKDLKKPSYQAKVQDKITKK